MTEEVTQTESVKIKKAPCQCKSKTPVLETFILETMKGNSTIHGIYCPECYSIKEWMFIPNETEEKPKAEKVKTEKPKKEIVKVSETTEQITEALVASISAEQVKEEVQAETKAKPETIAPILEVKAEPTPLELTPEEGKAQTYFPIVSVNPVKGITDQIAFMLTMNGLPFTIKVKNSPDKVTDAVNNPSRFVGKFVELAYTNVDDRGFPVDPKMKSLKTRDEVNQILNPVTV